MSRRRSSSLLAEDHPLIRIPLFSNKLGSRKWRVRLPDGYTMRSVETLECGRTVKTCLLQHTKLNKLQDEKEGDGEAREIFLCFNIKDPRWFFLWRYTPGEPLSVVILIGKELFCKAFRFRLGVEPFKKILAG